MCRSAALSTFLSPSFLSLPSDTYLTQLRNNATGGIILDTREPGLVELRNELSMRTLAPDTLKPVVVRMMATLATFLRYRLYIRTF